MAINPPTQIEPLGETWREIPISKVLQDKPLQQVYKDSQNSYFGTTHLTNNALQRFHSLMFEILGGKGSCIIDRWGNEYRTVDWSEVRDLTWKGQPLFTQATPTRTRPTQSTYSTQTIEPPMQGHGNGSWAPRFAKWNLTKLAKTNKNPNAKSSHFNG